MNCIFFLPNSTAKLVSNIWSCSLPSSFNWEASFTRFKGCFFGRKDSFGRCFKGCLYSKSCSASSKLWFWCSPFKQRGQIRCWQSSSVQKRSLGRLCLSHKSASGCLDETFCPLVEVDLFMFTRMYLFCGKLFSFLVERCLWRHCGHCNVSPRINCPTRVSHSIWVHGRSLGMWSPVSSNSSKPQSANM